MRTNSFSATSPTKLHRIQAWSREAINLHTYQNRWHTGHIIAGTQFCSRIKGHPIPFLATARDEVMAKKSFGDLTWVDIDLNAAAKKDFKTAFNNGDDSLLFDLQACLDSGLKFSLSWDDSRSAYRCTVVCKELGNVNDKKGFGSFAKTPIEALCVAAYKITTVANGGVWESAPEDDIG